MRDAFVVVVSLVGDSNTGTIDCHVQATEPVLTLTQCRRHVLLSAHLNTLKTY